jgi:pilus assembly protein TadC
MKLAVVNHSENDPKIYSSKLKMQMARSLEMFVCLSHYTATYTRKRLEKLLVKTTNRTASLLFQILCMFYQSSFISLNARV